MRAIHYIALLGLLLVVSCTKNITVDLPQPESQVVVEGIIENDVPPYVLLTQNAPYFGDIDLNDLESYFVHGAMMKVTTDDDSVMLVEYCVQDFPEAVQRELAQAIGFSFDDSSDVPNVCMYSVPNIINYYLYDDTSVFMGKVGKKYDLTIDVMGEQLTASTTIPGLLPIGLSLRPHDDPDADSLMTVLITFDDPDTSGNFMRYFTKRNDESFYPPLSSSAFDDNLVSGGVVTLPLERGQPKNSEIDFDVYGYFWKGDTVTIKFAGIDKAHYDFWHTIESDGGDSPFSAPVQIKSNINGGLGVWGGYGATYTTIIIPE